jgi:hypothetical protein
MRGFGCVVYATCIRRASPDILVLVLKASDSEVCFLSFAAFKLCFVIPKIVNGLLTNGVFLDVYTIF